MSQRKRKLTTREEEEEEGEEGYEGYEGWDEEYLENLFDENGEKKDESSEIYLPIRPEGPITGAVWENGRWIHVGHKRKRFKTSKKNNNSNNNNNNIDGSEEYLDPHTNVVTNPKKKQKFLMKVEQSEIEKLSSLVKRHKPPRHINPVSLLLAQEKIKANSQSNKNNSYTDNSNKPSVEYPEGMDAALEILQSGGNNFTIPETFNDLFISQYTKHVLQQNKYIFLTDIQKLCIPHALVGRDVLGAAKTGSGKTLAFVLPLLENLYRKAWHSRLGLGALVLAPTRELALQIFDTIRMIGKRLRHLSVGLIIGGRHSKMEDEQRLIGHMAILVGTPGRLLSHFENSSELNASNLQMLVVDEADLMLEIGMLDQVQKIIDYLPRKRQTMLFSATLTVEIVKLAKVSLRRPVFIPVDAPDAHALPKQLMQTYVEVQLSNKYNLLWSFMQTHINDKIIVFFATVRQVKYTRRIFQKLRPFAAIVPLHSEMKQLKRMAMYEKFKKLKNRGVLLCTEVASRGLDFPNIDWVINFDVPSNIKTYIHRVGRAARLGQKGNSITFIIPSEHLFVEELKKYNIIVKKLGVREQQLKPISEKMRTILATDDKMHELAKKAFLSFLKFYYHYGNDTYMSGENLNKDELASMFGLMHTPKYLQVLKKYKKNKEKETKKIKSLKDENMPNELKILLMDTKKKMKQKEQLKAMALNMDLDQKYPQDNDDGEMSELDKRLQMAAENTAQNMNDKINPQEKKAKIAKSYQRMILPAIDESDAPQWWNKAFKDREDVEINQESDISIQEPKNDTLQKWLEEDMETTTQTQNEIEEVDEDMLEENALQAILSR